MSALLQSYTPVKKPRDAGARPQAMCSAKSTTSSTLNGPRASLPDATGTPAHPHPASAYGPRGPWLAAQRPCAPLWPRQWPACPPASLGRCSAPRAACSGRWAGPWPCRAGQCCGRGRHIVFWVSSSTPGKMGGGVKPPPLCQRPAEVVPT